MRIGLGSNNLKTFVGGVQTWTSTVVAGLKKNGYEAVWYDIHDPIPDADVYIIAHTSIMRKHLRAGIKASLIVHGTIPKLERPIAGAEKYFAVSEEVEQFIEKLGFHCTQIIRNPIDTDRFENVGCRKRPEKILISNYRRNLPFIDKLRNHFNVSELSPRFQCQDVENMIRDADIVIATGRAAYEAMSMGKNVIIAGQAKYNGVEYIDGFIDNDSFYKYRRFNCSGRFLLREMTWDILWGEIEKYDESQGYRNALLIRNHNDYKKIARDLVFYAR